MKYLVFVIAAFVLFEVSYGYTNEIIHVQKVKAGISGSGTTTRYWDCCKPSCAWSANLADNTSIPVANCAADGVTKIDKETRSSCVGGTAYMCSDEVPTAVNSSYAIGYAAASFTGGADTSFCCACMELTFGGGLSGKKMVIQVTNTGGDLGSNQFDLAIPGGGVGIFTQGCSTQWGTGPNGWGDQYGGVSSAAQCADLPKDLQDGCRFRFEWMDNVSNPPVTFDQVTCPDQLVSVSGCPDLS